MHYKEKAIQHEDLCNNNAIRGSCLILRKSADLPIRGFTTMSKKLSKKRKKNIDHYYIDIHINKNTITNM